MSRFFVTPDLVGERNISIENKEDLHHMIKVLRLREGDEIDISDSEEWEYHVRITELQSDFCECEILDKQKFAREPYTKVTLYQGVPKQGKMELIIQKNVELGVNCIVPVFMERSVVKDNGKFGKKIDRWQKISDEAVKQCKRGIIPEVRDVLSFTAMIGEFAGYDLVLFPYENEDGTTIKDVLRAIRESDAESPECIAVVIGPEGGFADKEADAIVAAGGRSVSLGKTILRTETAGMATLAMVMYELEM